MAVYAEHAPPSALRDLVACGWTLTSAEPLPEHRVLPDGCMDIVVSDGAAAHIAGPSTRAFLAPMRAGGFAAGLRFRPGAAPSVLGVAADELRDAGAALSDVWDLRDAGSVAECQSADDALAGLYALVQARLPSAREPDPLVRAAVRRLATDPSARIADVATDLGLGERQLHRRFTRHVGYGPKRFARVLRLQRLLAAPPEPWAARALTAGYADQAHMARECAALTGRSPTQLA